MREYTIAVSKPWKSEETVILEFCNISNEERNTIFFNFLGQRGI